MAPVWVLEDEAWALAPEDVEAALDLVPAAVLEPVPVWADGAVVWVQALAAVLEPVLVWAQADGALVLVQALVPADAALVWAQAREAARE